MYMVWYGDFRTLSFFFKQKTAYEMRISDWSSDVCSSDLRPQEGRHPRRLAPHDQAERRLCGEGAVDLIGEQPVDIEHLDLIVVQRDHPRDRAGLAREDRKSVV